jgi:hypothetical protein
MIFFEIFILIIFLVILIIGFSSEFYSNIPVETFDEQQKLNQTCQLKKGTWYPYGPDKYGNEYWGWKPYDGLWPYYNPWWYYPYPYPTPIGYNSCISKLK